METQQRLFALLETANTYQEISISRIWWRQSRKSHAEFYQKQTLGEKQKIIHPTTVKWGKREECSIRSIQMSLQRNQRRKHIVRQEYLYCKHPIQITSQRRIICEDTCSSGIAACLHRSFECLWILVWEEKQSRFNCSDDVNKSGLGEVVSCSPCDFEHWGTFNNNN